MTKASDPIVKIRVLIVDDHAVVRAGLRMLTNPQLDMEVVSEAADGHEALALKKGAEKRTSYFSPPMERNSAMLLFCTTFSFPRVQLSRLAEDTQDAGEQ